MVSGSLKTASLLLLGIGLLVNPLYLVPGDFDGTGTEYRYEVESIDRTDARSAVTSAERTLQCGTERACALEHDIVENGPITTDSTVDAVGGQAGWSPYGGTRARYDLVRIDERFYVPEQSSGESGTVLRHRELSAWEALEYLAIPSDRASPASRRAIEHGSITLVNERIPAFERGEPIQHDGDYYRAVSRGTDDTVEHLLLVRILAFVTGAALVATAWYYRGRE